MVHMAKFDVQPNEVIIEKEISVQHGFSFGSAYTDELILTNENIYCISKGLFGNTKNVFCYPLNQIKKYNGKPQITMGKLSNGQKSLEISFTQGTEVFSFQAHNNGKITKWIQLVNDALGYHEDENSRQGFAPDTTMGEIVGAFKDLKATLGIKTTKRNTDNMTVTKKCISCSAPLTGKKGQIVHCMYCDTDQTL